MFRIALILFISLIAPFGWASVREVPFTLEDRDRIIKIEEKLNSQQQQINELKESMQQQINGLKEQNNELKESMQRQMSDIKTLFYWGFGILLSLSLFILGYIIWDRRTAMYPLQEKTFMLNENFQKLLISLREFAKDQPRMQEIFRMHGLL